MRLRIALMVVLMAASLVACGDDDGTDGTGGFSAETRRRYMEGCTTAQTEAFCQCTLDELAKRFSEEELMAFAIDGSEEPPEEFIEVTLACIAEADLGG